MEYCIRSALDPATLVEMVRRSMEKGWIPQGGIAVDDTCLYQAMIKNEG